MLEIRGPQAARIAEVWWVMLAVCTFAFVVIMAFFLWALYRSGRGQPTDTPEFPPGPERGKTRVVVAGVGVSILLLFALLVHTVIIDREISTLPAATNTLTIEVIGHQWWWEVRYLDDIPSRIVTTANEIHIPVGEPVVFQLRTRDVIHSFWVPNLHGKMDLTSGHVNSFWLQADEPGVFRGQCAEFCGLQHALMGFLVIAQPPEEFTAWLERQRQPATPPTDPLLARGQEVFLSAPCVLCHTIRGTGAFGFVAPDLTHIGSRRTIAAATLPNTRGNMAAWIVDPQHIKPGNFMPPTHLDPENLQALLAYLESLK